MPKSVKLILIYVIAMVVLTLSLCGLVYIYAKLIETQNELAVAVAVLDSYRDKLDPIKRPEIKPILIDWVYKNSIRISKQTAADIVSATLKTDHPILLLALIRVESEFNPAAVSSVGAKGLGQIRFEVHKKALATLNITDARDLFDIDKNIVATELILMDMLRMNKGNIVKTLDSYVGGTIVNYRMKVLSRFTEVSVLIRSKEAL